MDLVLLEHMHARDQRSRNKGSRVPVIAAFEASLPLTSHFQMILSMQIGCFVGAGDLKDCIKS